MDTTNARSRALTAALALGLGLAACTDGVEEPLAPQLALEQASSAGEAAGRFEVFTQNVYLGGETRPLFSLDFSNIPAVIQATNVFWGQVQASDVPARMREVVDEIEHELPHVVGLQEVLRFGVLDANFQPIGGIDFLALIEAEISARGLPYETEVVQVATSSALPLEFDPSTGGISRWLSFTDRVVTLRRSDVALIDNDGGVYAARIQLGPIAFVRAWARTTVRFRGIAHHLVTTQLETQNAPPIQAAQANELRTVLVAGLDGVTIIAGDLNSNAAAGPGDPTWTPTYGALVADGFIDVWLSAPHPTPAMGLTCCHANSLLGDEPFDQRIDFVLVRASHIAEEDDDGWDDDGWANRRGLFRSDIVGEEAADRTGSGLWPSDHAGLFGSFRVPRDD